MVCNTIMHVTLITIHNVLVIHHSFFSTLGSLHTQHWEFVTMTLQALSLVERRSWSKFASDQRSTWMARWMYSLHGLLHGIKWIIFHGHLDYSQKSHLEDRPNTKTGHHGTPNTHNCWFSLFYVWRSTWIEFIGRAFGWGPGHIWLRTTLEGPWPQNMILKVVLGWPLDAFFWALTISWSRLLAVCEVGLRPGQLVNPDHQSRGNFDTHFGNTSL